MSSPIMRQSVDAADAAATGSSTRTLGHYHLSLFAAATADPSGGLTVALEASPDGERWATIAEVSSFDEDPDSGEFTGSTEVTGAYYEFLRARVTSHAGGTVDAYVGAGGNAGQGRQGTSREGPVQS